MSCFRIYKTTSLRSGEGEFNIPDATLHSYQQAVRCRQQLWVSICLASIFYLSIHLHLSIYPSIHLSISLNRLFEDCLCLFSLFG